MFERNNNSLPDMLGGGSFLAAITVSVGVG